VEGSGAAPHIGTLGEKSLHSALKQWYARPGDLVETRLSRYVIDIQRGDLLIEIQTRQLYKLRKKLAWLLDQGYTVRLVHPVKVEKWIVRENASGEVLARRKSPKKGKVLDAFRELGRCGEILLRPGFVLEIVLVQVEEHWRDDRQGSWRRKGWSLQDHHLLGVVEQQVFSCPEDYLAVLPGALPQPFTNRELAKHAHCTVLQAGHLSYTLRALGLVEVVGKKGQQYVMLKK